jgi:beta-xylosidase
MVGALLTTEMAKNPVIWADVPDISIVRVGRDYYMSSTTMHMSPGLPIMKSKDLVHWKLVSYAYKTLGDNDALTLSNGKNAYGKGSWASSLRFHNGRFYVSTFSSTTGKTYIYSTRNPEKTPWKEVSFSPSLHDHSLFFDDDGKVYMAYGAGDIRLVELKPDLSGPQPGGFNDVIVRDASRIAGPNVGLRAEGSQLFKVGGKYNLCNITWPRGGMRTEIVHRADRITGPYEGRIMFQDSGVAQGGIVDTPNGKWYAYLFQDHGAVGRIPYLVPMRWEDGWPVVGENGKLPTALDILAGRSTLSGIVASDEFKGKELPLAWQWNHNPDDRYWSLNERPGWLRLTTGRVDETVTQARNTLTQRTFGPECSGTTALDVSGMKDGDRAGLIALQNRYAYVGVKMEGGARSVVMVANDGAAPVEVANVPLGANRVLLRMECDFRDQKDLAQFAYSLDGKTWTSIGNPHKLRYDLVHFMGCRFGLFNYATKTPGGHVDFDFFHVGERLTFSQS